MKQISNKYHIVSELGLRSNPGGQLVVGVPNWKTTFLFEMPLFVPGEVRGFVVFHLCNYSEIGSMVDYFKSAPQEWYPEMMPQSLTGSPFGRPLQLWFC